MLPIDDVPKWKEKIFLLKRQITCREYKAGNALQGKKKQNTFNSIV